MHAKFYEFCCYEIENFVNIENQRFSNVSIFTVTNLRFVNTKKFYEFLSGGQKMQKNRRFFCPENFLKKSLKKIDYVLYLSIAAIPPNARNNCIPSSVSVEIISTSDPPSSAMSTNSSMMSLVPTTFIISPH